MTLEEIKELVIRVANHGFMYISNKRITKLYKAYYDFEDDEIVCVDYETDEFEVWEVIIDKLPINNYQKSWVVAGELV